MSNETTALKQSFFKDYLRHKMRGLKGFTITFAVMNFCVITVFALSMLIGFILMLSSIKNYNSAATTIAYVYAFVMVYIAFFILGVLAAEMVLIAIMTTTNVKFYNSRSAMDTLGGLPLTTTERFWGDFLSGALSFIPSFLGASILAVGLMTYAQLDPLRELNELNRLGHSEVFILFVSSDNAVLIILTIILAVFISLAGAYAVSFLVASCCGRKRASITFSLAVIIGIPMIVGSFGNFLLKFAVGVNANRETIKNAVCMIPPVGTIFDFVATLVGAYGDYQAADQFAILSPKIIVMLAIIALSVLGSYIIAKKRKAENIDSPIVFNTLYTAATVLVTLAAFALIFAISDTTAFILPVIIFAVAACFFIEFFRSHSKITFWKGIVKFAVTGALCVGFAVLVKNTESFGIGYKVPDKNNVKSVTVGVCDYNTFSGGEVYATISSDNGISTVIDKHRILTENIKYLETQGYSGYISSETIYLQYHLKSGKTLTRCYCGSPGSGYTLVQGIVTDLTKLPEIYNMTTLGVIGNPDIPCLSAIVQTFGSGEYYVRQDAMDDFRKCLFEDLSSNSSHDNDGTYIGTIKYTFYNSFGEEDYFSIPWSSNYKNLEKFMSDPSNIQSAANIEIEDNARYTVSFNDHEENGDDQVSIRCEITAKTETGRELISYFSSSYANADEVSDKFRIYDQNYHKLVILKKDEEKALSAFIKAFREQQRGE